ncbi:MAG TPA: hypothetical protein VM123_00775 [archaeon]|nr:hypothetical protein [archaeon]
MLSNGDETDNFRYFQYLKMKLSNKGEKSSISFRTYLRVSDDLNPEYTDDSLWRLYNGYLQWDRGITSFSLGRQWLHLGPGSLTLDGLKVSIGSQGRHKLTGYFGTESPYSRSFGTLGWERARSGGIYFSTRPVSRADIGLGWYQKNRAGEVALREIGFNGKLRLPIDLDLSGRLDLNLLTDRVQKGIVRFSYRGIKRLSFTGEYKHYEPRLFYQSYFRRFKPEANDQVRGGVVFFLRPEVTLSMTYSAIFFEEESSSYLSLGASCPYGSVTYYRGDGYGGDENGFAVGASLPFAKKFELFADLDYSRYRFYEDEDRDYLFSSIFGINWQPRKDINASLEFEDFNNDAFSKDFRALIKVAYNFSNVF